MSWLDAAKSIAGQAVSKGVTAIKTVFTKKDDKTVETTPKPNTQTYTPTDNRQSTADTTFASFVGPTQLPQSSMSNVTPAAGGSSSNTTTTSHTSGNNTNTSSSSTTRSVGGAVVSFIKNPFQTVKEVAVNTYTSAREKIAAQQAAREVDNKSQTSNVFTGAVTGGSSPYAFGNKTLQSSYDNRQSSINNTSSNQTYEIDTTPKIKPNTLTTKSTPKRDPVENFFDKKKTTSSGGSSSVTTNSYVFGGDNQNVDAAQTAQEVAILNADIQGLNSNAYFNEDSKKAGALQTQKDKLSAEITSSYGGGVAGGLILDVGGDPNQSVSTYDEIQNNLNKALDKPKEEEDKNIFNKIGGFIQDKFSMTGNAITGSVVPTTEIDEIAPDVIQPEMQNILIEIDGAPILGKGDPRNKGQDTPSLVMKKVPVIDVNNIDVDVKTNEITGDTTLDPNGVSEAPKTPGSFETFVIAGEAGSDAGKSTTSTETVGEDGVTDVVDSKTFYDIPKAGERIKGDDGKLVGRVNKDGDILDKDKNIIGKTDVTSDTGYTLFPTLENADGVTIGYDTGAATVMTQDYIDGKVKGSPKPKPNEITGATILDPYGVSDGSAPGYNPLNPAGIVTPGLVPDNKGQDTVVPIMDPTNPYNVGLDKQPKSYLDDKPITSEPGQSVAPGTDYFGGGFGLNTPDPYIPSDKAPTGYEATFNKDGTISGYANAEGNILTTSEVALGVSAGPDGIVTGTSGNLVMRNSEEDPDSTVNAFADVPLGLKTNLGDIADREADEKYISDSFDSGKWETREDMWKEQYGDMIENQSWDEVLGDITNAMRPGDKETTGFNYDRKSLEDTKAALIWIGNQYIAREHDNYEKIIADVNGFQDLVMAAGGQAQIKNDKVEEAQKAYDDSVGVLDNRINAYADNNAVAWSENMEPRFETQEQADSYNNLINTRNEANNSWMAEWQEPLEKTEEARAEAVKTLAKEYPEMWEEYKDLAPGEQQDWLQNIANEAGEQVNSAGSGIRNILIDSVEDVENLDWTKKQRNALKDMQQGIEWDFSTLGKGAGTILKKGGTGLLQIVGVAGSIVGAIADGFITGPFREWKEDKQEDFLQFAQENPELARELSETADEKGNWRAGMKGVKEFNDWQKQKDKERSVLAKVADVGSVVPGTDYIKYVGKNLYDWEDPMTGNRAEGWFGKQIVADTNWKAAEGIADAALIATGVGAFGVAAKGTVLKGGMMLGKSIAISQTAGFVGRNAPRLWQDEETTNLISDNALVAGAMQRGLSFEQGAINARGDSLGGGIRNFLSELPGGKSIGWLAERDSFEFGVEQYYTDQGYSQAEAEKAAKALNQLRVGGELGEGFGIVAANVGSELFGRHTFNALHGTGAALAKDGVGYGGRWAAGFAATAPAGFVEGATLIAGRQAKQYKMIDTTEATMGGLGGAAFAGVLGGFMVGGSTVSKAASKTVGGKAAKGGGFISKYGTYMTDGGEYLGDKLADALVKHFPSVAAYTGGAGSQAHIAVTNVVAQASTGAITQTEAENQLRAMGFSATDTENMIALGNTDTFSAEFIGANAQTDAMSNINQHTSTNTNTAVSSNTGVNAQANAQVAIQSNPNANIQESTYVNQGAMTNTDTGTFTATNINANAATNTATNSNTNVNVAAAIPGALAGFGGAFPGDGGRGGKSGPGMAGWNTNNKIADYAGAFGKKAANFFSGGAGFAGAEAGRTAVQGATQIPVAGAVGGVGAALALQQYQQQQYQQQQYQQPQQSFNFKKPQQTQAPDPYYKAQAAVNNGFGNVGQNYGSVIKQGPKRNTTTSKKAGNKAAQMMGIGTRR